ncbi:MAG: hypothetical protein GY943_26315 [Chloroflexi bacterium]|nr:hypothetical protein [Chloroflexota bacterium]
MSMLTQLQNRAVTLMNTGEKRQGRRILAMILAESPQNDGAWLQYAATFETTIEQIQVHKQWLRVVPNSHLARRGLSRLQARQINEIAHPKVTIRGVVVTVLVALVVILALAATLILYSNAVRSNDERYEATITGLEAENGILLDENELLGGSVSDLENENKNLNELYDTAVSANQNLQGDIVEAQSQVEALLEGNDDLNQKNEQLIVSVDNISRDQAALLAEIRRLKAEYPALLAASNSPLNVFSSNEIAYFVFEQANREPVQWEFSFEELARAVQKGDEVRSQNVMMEFQLANNVQRMVDHRLFIESSIFEQEMSAMSRNASNETEFIRDVWQLVTQLTLTASRIEGTPQLSLETLQTGSGDNEDLAILFASLILAAPYDWDVELVYIDSLHPRNLQEANRLLVMVDTGFREFYVDVTQSEDMEPYEAGTFGGWRYLIQ